jgi:hypothetical protein
MSTHYFSCSGGSGVDPDLVFCILIDMWITYYVQVCPWRETSMHYFSCSGGPGADPIKSTQGHVTRSCVSAYIAICVSHSVF